jgi:hypothetical protein
MKINRKLGVALAALALPLALSACVDDDYGGGMAVAYNDGPYDYDGYYDGYYGDFYDGYWGGDGAFYYRNHGTDRSWHRGDRAHFSQTRPNGRGNFQSFHRSFTPPSGAHMPHFVGHGGGGGHHGH